MREYIDIISEASPNLKFWFRSSKIIDDEGQPLAVHHFTYNDFTVFDRHWATHHFKRDPERLDTLGFWFTDNSDARYGNPEWGAKRMDCYLRMEKPLYLDDDPSDRHRDAWSQLRDMAEKAGGATALRAQLVAQGYDGVCLVGTFLDTVHQNVMIVFEPGQIKSVQNSGDFNPEDPDILL